MPPSPGVVTYLFTDIEGSTRLWEQQPERMRMAMARHDVLARAAVENNRGTVVKPTGDGLHASFVDPLDALAAALALQQALADPLATEGVGLRVRCGLHAGVDDRRDQDFFGRAVNRAARIMSVAHGGQVVLSQAVVELVRDRLLPGTSLRDLGSVWLRDMSHPEHLYQLEHPKLTKDFPPLRADEPVRTNLPSQQTSFVGREEELRQIKELLIRHRLVSLVGSGGIGKTRLALQVGTELQGAFADGSWFADLAPVGAPGQVAERVASMFARADSGESSAIEAVLGCLRRKQLLLILDNCEHVLAEAVRLINAILRTCPEVTVLATSRESLSVQGEHVWRVQPLAFPEQPESVSADEAMRYGAVQLFVSRAEAALGRFALTDSTASVVAAICKRLDGIALAIELAAPRLKILKPEELLKRLNMRFQLLTGGDRTALPRQQTLLAATDWSYRLLSGQEQTLLRRLAIFPDSFTIDSAEAVCGDAPIDARDVLDLVAALVDKSLVVAVARPSGTTRYRLLESTRAFGLDRLRESADTGRQRLLCEYLIRTFQEAERQWDTTSDTQWYDAYEPELENVRTTLAWAMLGPEGDSRLGIALVGYTLHLVQWRSRAQRQRWFAIAAASFDETVPAALVARVKLGIALSVGANPRQRKGSAQALEAAEIFGGLGDAKNQAWALAVVADALLRPGDTAEAEAYYQRAEALLRPFGTTKQLASVLASKALTRGFWAGDTVSARKLFDECLTLARAVGYRRLIEATTIHQAEIEAIDGHYQAAIAKAREAEVASRQSGNEYFLFVTLGNLTGYLLAVGDVDAARHSGEEALLRARSHGDAYWVSGVLERLTLAAALAGDAARAARLAGYCEERHRSGDIPREQVEQRLWQTLMAQLDAALAPVDKTRFMAEGAAWDEEQAAAAALSSRAPLAGSCSMNPSRAV